MEMMEGFFFMYVGLLGALFGSFASVVISRIRSKEKGIFLGRSRCSTCEHQLKALDLVPLFSFLSTGGTCRYCKTRLSLVYPLLELTMAVLFVLVVTFLIDIERLFLGFHDEWVRLFVYLLLAFCTVVYVFYDILYLEIPETILTIANLTALVYLFYGVVFFGDFSLFESIVLSLATLLIATVLYIIMWGQNEEKIDILFLGGILMMAFALFGYFGMTMFEFAPLGGILAGYTMFVFFYIQYVISSGTWIGGGDFRIAILMGLMLGFSSLFIGFFATYICGSIVGIFMILWTYFKTGKRKENMAIPFGPFLAFGIFITLFFGSDLRLWLDLYL